MTEFEKYAIKHKGISSINMHNYQSIIAKSTTINPVVLEEHELKATAVDVFSRLMMDRIIILGDSIYDETANIIMSQLLFLNAQDNTKPIQMYINSPGGAVSAGLQIYDTMQMIKSPVHTICTGSAASMAAILLSGGEKGKRGALPNAEIMIHQPLGGAIGQASDIEIASKNIQNIKMKLCKILAENTGKDVDNIIQDMDRDFWMSPEEALQYGLIDKVFNGKGII